MACGRLGWSRLRRGGNDYWLWFVIQRRFAPAAEMVICPKLDEMAMVATNYFPRVDRRKICGHSGCTELPERGTPPKGLARARHRRCTIPVNLRLGV